MRLASLGMLLALVLAGCGSESGPAPTPDPEPESPRKPATPNSGTVAQPGSNDPNAPYPVVLLHGMGGFGTLNVGPLDVTYFNGVVDDLKSRGVDVYVTLAPAYDTSEVRAAEIAKQIDAILQKTGKPKVNLIGHSQGGLDARVLASPAGLGYGDRIASVTTVASPHRGSKVADLALGLTRGVSQSTIDAVTSGLLQVVEKTAYELQSDPHLRAQVLELSESYMQGTFNPKYVDDPRVFYSSYAGRTNRRTGEEACGNAWLGNDPTALDTPILPLAPMADFLEEGKQIPNDGLVTVDSAKWGVFMQCVAADHMKEVGQPSANQTTLQPFDQKAFFRAIVDRIRARGF